MSAKSQVCTFAMCKRKEDNRDFWLPRLCHAQEFVMVAKRQQRWWRYCVDSVQQNDWRNSCYITIYSHAYVDHKHSVSTSQKARVTILKHN